MNNQNVGDGLTIKLVLLGYSIVFLCLLTLGYFYLFVGFGFVAWMLAPILPLIAWGIAKIIGSSVEGIPGHVPLFILLLLISSAGMFNALMLTLEGPVIFKEVIASSDKRFAELQAVTAPLTRVEDQFRAEVTARAQAFFFEIRNAIQPGEGEVASENFKRLQELLPNLRRAAGKPTTQQQREQRIADYKRQIDEQTEQTKEVVQGKESKQLALDIGREATSARTQLTSLTDYVNSGGRLLPNARLTLEELDHQYSALAGQANRLQPDLKLSRELDLGSIGNLGQWNQVLNLLIARSDRLQTYVYLCFAIFADWMLIYQFRLARLRGTNASPVPPKDSHKRSNEHKIWS